MNARRRLYTLIFLVILGPVSIFAQSFPLEKTSLLCDREVYLSGEILSFSANIRQSVATEVPLSTTLYLDVLDGNGKPVAAQKHEITARGQAYGSLELPNLLPTGAYFVRAYTQYQKNLAPETHTTQLILVVNPDSEIETIPVSLETALDFRFETGTPIAGLSNLLVVRTSTESPTHLLTAQNQETGTLLKTVGSFELWEVPVESHEQLRVETVDTTQNLTSSPFPATRSLGIMASVKATEEVITSVFYPAPSIMSLSSTAYQVELYDQNFQLVSRYTHDLKADGFRFTCARNDVGFPEVFLTLRSMEGELMYIGAIQTGLLPTETQTNTVFAPRSLASFPLSAQMDGMYSVSVRKRIPIPAQMVLDIAWTNPWLIPNMMVPDSLAPFTSVIFHQYLQEKGQMLMGQRMNTWLPESRDLSISGLIQTANTQEPAAGVLVVVSVVGQAPQIHPQTTDEHGRFQIPLRNLSGAETIFLGMNEPSGVDLTMAVNRDFRPETPPVKPVPFTTDDAFHHLVEELYLSSQITSQYQQPPVRELLTAREIPSLPANLGSPDVSVKVADFIDMPSVEEMILNVIPKVSLNRADGILTMNVYEDRTLAIHENPLVLLDYAVVFDLEALMKVSPAKLNQFDIYQGEYYLGDQKFTGIVSILTHTDDFARYPFDEYGAFVQIKTIQPDAGVSMAVTNTFPTSVPDFRPVLYWHPATEGEISFRTSDWEGEYEVVVKNVDEISVDQRPKVFKVRQAVEN